MFFRSVDDEKKTASYSLTCESEMRLAHAVLEEHKEDDPVRREGEGGRLRVRWWVYDCGIVFTENLRLYTCIAC